MKKLKSFKFPLMNNKKGTSDIFIVILQMLMVGMVMIFMVAKAGSVDLTFLKRTMVTQNLGLVMSATSFLPGSFSYAYLTNQDGKMGDWDEFPAKIHNYEIFYDANAENVESGNTKYQMFMNDLQYDMLNRIVLLKKKTIFLEKANEFTVSDKVEKDLRKFECKKTKFNLKIRPLYGGEETKFYDSTGKEISSDVEENYLNMEKQYFAGKKQVYPGNRGLKNGELEEATITYELANLLNPVTNVLIQPESLEEKHILLTLGDYDPTQNFMIIYLPILTFEEDYDIACNILNNILDTELKSQVDGLAIIPHSEKHIIFEMGNIAKPNNPLLINEINLNLIAEGIKNE